MNFLYFLFFYLKQTVMKEMPEDKDAMSLKVISLVKMGKYSDALKILPVEFAFERAYCLYRTNKLSESLSAIKAANSAELRFSYLLAQVVRTCYVFFFSLFLQFLVTFFSMSFFVEL
jgi:hypothetical protein